MSSDNLEPGTELEVCVHRISENKNAIVELDSGHLNLGKLSSDVVGETVQVIIQRDTQYGWCKEEKFRTSDYSPYSSVSSTKETIPDDKLNKETSDGFKSDHAGSWENYRSELMTELKNL